MGLTQPRHPNVPCRRINSLLVELELNTTSPSEVFPRFLRRSMALHWTTLRWKKTRRMDRKLCPLRGKTTQWRSQDVRFCCSLREAMEALVDLTGYEAWASDGGR